MPYDSVSNLLASVRDNLPSHAREVYLAAFNNAWDEHKNAQDWKGGASREEVAHKVAWSAVKNKYEKTKVWNVETQVIQIKSKGAIQ